METQILTEHDDDIAVAGEIIKNGGLVAFPTETVYGLGANALDERAVKSIYIAKGRPSDNPLIVHIADKRDILSLVTEIPHKAQMLMDHFFPGPLTVILKKSEKISSTVSGGLDTVAVRMPENETARKIIAASGCPVAAPSANTSGLPSPTRANYVMDDMMGKIDAVVDGGDCEYGVESTVISLAEEPPLLLRPGAVTKEMIEELIGEIRLSPAVLEELKKNETAQSPGMKYQHYSPKAKVVLVVGDREKYESFVNTRKDAFALCFEEDQVTVPKVTYGKERSDLSQAKELFDALRRLDRLGAKKVYARAPGKNGVGMAVYNRLIRAAAFRVIDLEKPFFIGLTGPTGAGKGFVGNYLRELGFPVLDTDLYARKITEKNSPLFPELQKNFGNDIIKEGCLDRKLLAQRVFGSSEQLEKLNALTHPAIIALCERDAKGLTVLDAPLLFESGANEKCCKIICVTADESTRRERIVRRDSITPEEAQKRMGSQKPDPFYRKHSDYTVFNDGRDIKEQIDRILEEIL